MKDSSYNKLNDKRRRIRNSNIKKPKGLNFINSSSFQDYERRKNIINELSIEFPTIKK